jgi:hypothetical protein
MQQHSRPQADVLRQPPEMGGDVHIAVPGEHRPACSSRRQPAQPVVDHRHRLDQGQVPPPLTPTRLRDGKKGRAKRQHPRPVRTGAFRKQDQIVARLQRLPHRIALLAGGGPAARNEYRPPEPRDRADDRPTGDIALGDETAVQHAADDRDIHPGGMVRDVDDAPPAGSLDLCSDHPHPDPDQPREHPPVDAREHHLCVPRRDQAHCLDQHRGKRPGQHGKAAPDHAHPPGDQPTFAPCRQAQKKSWVAVMTRQQA